MGRRHRADIVAVQMCKNRRGKSRALGGVRTCAELIEEHQRILVRSLQNLHRVGHVRGEGTQGLLDALLIADIGVNFLEKAHLRARLRRHGKSCLRHDGKQADGL